jgi:hypothetical protein
MPVLPPGSSAIYTTQPGDPALGASLIFPVPFAVRWRLISIEFTYTCSAVAGNRNPFIQFQFAPTANAYANPNLTMVAGGSVSLNAVAGQTQFPLNLGSRRLFDLPPDLELPSTSQIIIDALGRLAGDQISTVRFAYQEWITP